MSLARVEDIAPARGVQRVTLDDMLPMWREVAEFASHIAATEFVPADLRNKPASVAAAMLRANELGISPMQGLAQIHVIKGRPGLAAELMRALVLAAGHDIWTEELTVTRVTLCGRRTGSDHVEKVTWTGDDAKRAGLGGDNWRKYPRAMLLARATGELCRLAFADVLAGMSYTVEELETLEADDDLPPEPGTEDNGNTPPPAPTGTTRKAARPTAKAKKAASRASGRQRPPLPGEEPKAVETTGVDADPDDLVVKRAQQIAIKAGEAGVDHHQVVAAVTNGEKSSAKAVTADEASQVVEALHAIRDGRASLEQDGATWKIVANEPDTFDIADAGLHQQLADRISELSDDAAGSLKEWWPSEFGSLRKRTLTFEQVEAVHRQIDELAP